MGWTSEHYGLPEGHGWTVRPGHKILVVDSGAVVLEFPAVWVAEPGSRQIEIRDAADPEQCTCVLAVSFLRLPSRDWSDVPLSRLLLEAVGGDDRERIATGPPVESEREGLELAWTKLRVVDPGERRESRSRLCLARGCGLQCLLTFDFWPEDAERLTPVWEGVLRSLRLGLQLEDPTRGGRLE